MSHHNVADVRSIDSAGKKQKEVERQQIDDLRKILDSDHGRRFLWRLLVHCRINASVFEPNSKIAYNSGMQDVGHFVLGEIVKARPEAYLLMMQEHQEKKDETA